MMHTERIGEDHGKIMGMRVVEATPELVKCEFSSQEKGKILGIEYESVTTYWSGARPDGNEYGEGKGALMTVDNEIVAFHASGIGKSRGKGFEGKFRATVYFESKSPSSDIQRLCKSPVLAEYESDEEGNTKTTYYEWQY